MRNNLHDYFAIPIPILCKEKNFLAENQISTATITLYPKREAGEAAPSLLRPPFLTPNI